ncbi:MAG: FadR family transcriptional regulator [Thalassovita sp.]
MKFPELKIPNAVDVLENKIESLIFSGAIRPNTSLPSERRFAEDIGVSRTTLREAFSRLRAKGLLRSHANRHQISDVIDVILSQAFYGLGPNDGALLFDILTETAVEMTRLSLDKTNDIDAQRAQLAAERLAQALRLPSLRGEDLYPLVYDLILKMVEANSNFFGIQVVHALLSGFQTALSAALAAPHQIDVFRRSVDALCAAIPQHNPDQPQLLRDLLDHLHDRLRRSDQGVVFQATRTPSAPTPQETAFHDLSKRIETGTYPLHHALPAIKDLAVDLGHAENATKLALHHLEACGMVTLGKLGRATVIAGAPRDPIAGLTDAILRQPLAVEATFEFRRMLETWTAKLAAHQISTPQSTAFAALFDAMEQVMRDDQKGYPHHDINFHNAIATYSNNPALSALLACFSQIIEQVTADWLSRHAAFAGDNSTIHEQHRAIFAAIIDHNAPAAATAMQTHLDYVLLGLKTLEKHKRYATVAEIRQNLSAPPQSAP